MPAFTAINGRHSSPTSCRSHSSISPSARQIQTGNHERRLSENDHGSISASSLTVNLAAVSSPDSSTKRRVSKSLGENTIAPTASRLVETVNGSMPPVAAPHMPVGEPNSFGSGNPEDPSRTSVHSDPTKRKRQFKQRTKTGCGTCRGRKKKCDEEKPECMPTSFTTQHSEEQLH
jgi:hypothetical protein